MEKKRTVSSTIEDGAFVVAVGIFMVGWTAAALYSLGAAIRFFRGSFR